MTPAEMIAAIREAEKKATPGPWEWMDEYDFREHIQHREQGLDAKCENIEAGRIMLEPQVLSHWCGDGDGGIDVKRDNATFIALSRQAVPVLLAEIDRLEAFVQYLKDSLANRPRSDNP